MAHTRALWTRRSSVASSSANSKAVACRMTASERCTPSDGETGDACDTVHTRNQLLMETVLLGLGQRSIRMHVRCTLCYASPVRWLDSGLHTHAMATRSVRER